MVLANPTSSVDELPSEPARVVRREEDGNVSDVLRLTCTAKRSLRDSVLVEVRSDEAGSMSAFGLDQSGVQCIHADALRSKLNREHTGDRIDRTLGAGVDRAVRRRNAANK